MTEYSPTELQFYVTAETACPYLPNRYERKLFTHLSGRRATDLHDMLSLHGFRRSQNIAYRPACEGCNACKSARVVVDQFQMNASQRRVWRKNTDLEAIDSAPRATEEQYALFQTYLKARHQDGGMADMSHLDYEFMVEDTPVHSEVIEYRQLTSDPSTSGELIAVALTDRLPDGISMVYSFFDPKFSKRSLGRFMILDQIRRAKRLGLPYLYLGYWVKNSPKMAYKADYQPIEILSTHEQWVQLRSDDNNNPRVSKA